MTLDRLTNCTQCGKLYAKTFTDYCMDCYLEIEEDFKIAERFLRAEENRNVTLEELSAATNVSAKRLSMFIRDMRIYAEDFPNLGYSCAHCPTIIKRQLLCAPCFEIFSSEMNISLKQDKLREEMKSGFTSRLNGYKANKYKK